ncbi:MAG: Rieske 2Fe-2S domain-containing protein [Planctomycetales bacterium]
MSEPATHTETNVPERSRRFFLWSFLSIVSGGVVAIVPRVPGLAVLTNPLRQRRRAGGRPIRITTMDALQGSLPQRFPVVAGRRDAWNKYPPEAIDAIYLLPQQDDKGQLLKPVAYSVTCPHLGCSIDFKEEQDEFQCPCHTSAFAVGGKTIYGPSPRGLDTLVVHIRRDGKELPAGQAIQSVDEVWIQFMKFEVGTAKKVPV